MNQIFFFKFGQSGLCYEGIERPQTLVFLYIWYNWYNFYFKSGRFLN